MRRGGPGSLRCDRAAPVLPGRRSVVTGDSLDLRLVPAALAVWVGATLTVLCPTRQLVAIGTAGVATVLGLLVLAAVRRPRGGPADARGPAGTMPATALLAVLVLLGALAAGAAQRHERSSGPLAEAVAAGWTATVRGTVADPPAPLAAPWAGAQPRVRFTLTVDSIEARGRLRGAHGALAVLAEAPGPALGAAVLVTGRLQTPVSLADRAVGTLAATGTAVTVHGPTGVDRWVGAVRAFARTVVAQVPGDAGGLLLGVALGDTSRIDPGLSDAFRVAGLTHLVAVSGAHFAIIGALVAGTAAACRLPRAARAAAVLAAGTLLVLLVGPQPSVLRAAVMGTVSLVGLLAGRPARAPAALAGAVLLLLLTDPWLALDLGFVLSVAATAAIVLLAGVWTERWAPRLGRSLAAALAVPLAAQLACGPVLLAVRPQVGAYALVANLLVAPAVGPATVFGVGAALLAPVWPGAALVLAHVGAAACWWIAAVGRVVAATPGAGVGWAPGAVGVLALLAVSAAIAALLLRVGPDDR